MILFTLLSNRHPTANLFDVTSKSFSGCRTQSRILITHLCSPHQASRPLSWNTSSSSTTKYSLSSPGSSRGRVQHRASPATQFLISRYYEGDAASDEDEYSLDGHPEQYRDYEDEGDDISRVRIHSSAPPKDRIATLSSPGYADARTKPLPPLPPAERDTVLPSNFKFASGVHRRTRRRFSLGSELEESRDSGSTTLLDSEPPESCGDSQHSRLFSGGLEAGVRRCRRVSEGLFRRWKEVSSSEPHDTQESSKPFDDEAESDVHVVRQGHGNYRSGPLVGELRVSDQEPFHDYEKYQGR